MGWNLECCKKSPPSRGGPGICVGFCGSLIKNSAGVELPLWRLSCNFTRTDCGLDLAMEDKALHMQWVALLDPEGQRLQHKFQVIPGTWFCYVLGMEMFVVATAVGRCIQESVLLTKEISQRIDCA